MERTVLCGRDDTITFGRPPTPDDLQRLLLFYECRPPSVLRMPEPGEGDELVVASRIINIRVEDGEVVGDIETDLPQGPPVPESMLEGGD